MENCQKFCVVVNGKKNYLSISESFHFTSGLLEDTIVSFIHVVPVTMVVIHMGWPHQANGINILSQTKSAACLDIPIELTSSWLWVRSNNAGYKPGFVRFYNLTMKLIKLNGFKLILFLITAALMQIMIISGTVLTVSVCKTKSIFNESFLPPSILQMKSLEVNGVCLIVFIEYVIFNKLT